MADEPKRDSSEALVERVEELSADIERISDPQSRRIAEDLLAAVIELYGEGLSRITEILDDEGADEIRQRLSDDGVVASLLLIHDLYPVSLEDRVLEALDSVRPYMESHGGDVELLSLAEGVATLRLEGSCDGCPASASTLELAIKSALEEAAPDLAGIYVEGLDQPVLEPIEVSGTPLPMAGAQNGEGQDAIPAPGGSAWHELNGEAEDLAENGLAGVEIGGRKLVVAKIEGSLLAYLDSCPGCESPIAGGALDEGMLTCPSCSRNYFLPRAGRSLDDERLQLAPVPLLETRDEGVRVALAR